MSITLSEEELLKIRHYLSPERLKTFERMSDNFELAISLHQKSMQLSALLMSIIGGIEIALRNRVCQELDKTFERDIWLSENFSLHHKSNKLPVWNDIERKCITKSKKDAIKAEYKKLTQNEKRALDDPDHSITLTHKKKSQLRIRNLQTSQGQIIAQFTFFFWKSIFSERHEHLIWKQSLKKVFPNKTLKRAVVAENLETLYQARNRIAHHEPIYGSRLKDILNTINFFVQNFDNLRPSSNSILYKLLESNISSLYMHIKTIENYKTIAH